jgi:hypothetical protein
MTSQTTVNNEYYWVETYKSGKNAGKPHFVYNWEKIIPELKKQIRWFISRKLHPNARKLYYNLWQAGKFPSGSSPYKALDDKLVDLRISGEIPWGVLQDDGRGTPNTYPDYWTPGDFLEDDIEKLKNVADRYYYPRWLRQKNYCELVIEKEADVDDFRIIVEGLEINVRKARGWGGWEEAYSAYKQVVRIMALEQTQKKVHTFYFGDMDPSGDAMGKHLIEIRKYFSNYDFGYGRYRLGYVEPVRLGITMDQIEKYNIALIPDKSVFDKLFGTSIAAGDTKDKKGDTRTAGYIKTYINHMKPGDRLPPIAELAALLSTDTLLEVTRRLVTQTVEPLFDKRLYNRLQSDINIDKAEIKGMLNDKVKFLSGDNDDN